MIEALEAVKGGLMGVNQALKNFEVPRAMLHERPCIWSSKHGAKSGPPFHVTE